MEQRVIKTVHLQNFKSHRNTRLELGNLTLLCGKNGVGKTSVIQCFLLLRQSFLKNRLHDGLDLNRPLCEIRTAQNALFQRSQENFIQFQLETMSGNNHCWQFLFDEENPQSTFLQRMNPEAEQGNYQTLGFLGNNFQYLSANRLAPQEFYQRDDYEVIRNRQLSLEKGRGELVAHFLYHYGQAFQVVSPLMLNINEKNNDLFSQTEAWGREISQKININVLNMGSWYEIKYSFDSPSGTSVNNLRAENVGFGVSSSLPLIVAILSAEKDALLLVENPEAHLHPSAQSKLAELMALAAQSGIQIIIETHSDHFVNGVLVACKKYEDGERGIDRNNARIYYFDRDEEQHATISNEIEIVEGGKINQQPKGFFDQIEQDLETLMGF